METQKTLNSKAILRKKNRAGGIKLPHIRLYYKATLIKIVWYWNKTRNIYQWNKIEIPEKNTHICWYLVFDKDSKNIQWRKDSLLSK